MSLGFLMEIQLVSKDKTSYTPPLVPTDCTRSGLGRKVIT